VVDVGVNLSLDAKLGNEFPCRYPCRRCPGGRSKQSYSKTVNVYILNQILGILLLFLPSENGSRPIQIDVRFCPFTAY